MNTYKLIKLTVEKASGINDLALQNRKRYFSDCRIVYFGLSRLYRKQEYHGVECSTEIRRNHACGINSVNRFNEMLGEKDFLANEVYHKCRKMLDPIFIYKLKNTEDELSFKRSRVEYLEDVLANEVKDLEILETLKALDIDLIYEVV